MGRAGLVVMALLASVTTPGEVLNAGGDRTSIAAITLPAASDVDLVPVWGPHRFVRNQGLPVAETVVITTPDFEHFQPPFVLWIRNGNEDGSLRVSSAVIDVDGVEIVGPSGFSQSVTEMSAEVDLADRSQLTVILRSAPVSQLTVGIDGVLKPGRKRIGPAGGTVVSENNVARVHVPPGALDTDKILVVQPFAGTFPDLTTIAGTTFSMQPDGTKFLHPATLTIQYEREHLPPGANEQGLRLARRAEDAIHVFDDSVVDIAAHTVTAAIDGFSVWGIVAPQNGEFVLETIAVGESHTCGLTPDGTAYCWGDNAFSKLGNRSPGFVDSPRPVRVEGADTNSDGIPDAQIRFAHITAGENHTCGVAVSGETYCWGDNQRGQLGVGDGSGVHSFPRRVATTEVFDTIVAGPRDTCALTADGRAFCWGDGTIGQLGFVAPDSCREVGRCSTIPRPVDTQLRFAHISPGESHTCALDLAGLAYCWGFHGGALGIGPPTGLFVTTPTAVELDGLGQWPDRWIEIASGWRVTCAVGAPEANHPQGRGVFCWGGHPTVPLLGRALFVAGEVTVFTRSPTPLAVEAFGHVAVSSVGFHSLAPSRWETDKFFGDPRKPYVCALMESDQLWCWGINESGQFGALGSDSPTQPFCESLFGRPCTVWPVQSPFPFPTIAQLGAGSRFMCANTPEGRTYCWGDNTSGQLGDGTLQSRAVPRIISPPE